MPKSSRAKPQPRAVSSVANSHAASRCSAAAVSVTSKTIRPAAAGAAASSATISRRASGSQIVIAERLTSGKRPGARRTAWPTIQTSMSRIRP